MEQKTIKSNDRKQNDFPLENIIRDGGMMNIFRSIGCIGDSLTSGEFECIGPDGEKVWWDCYEYSWGKQMERITGIQMTNFSRGGLTAYQLYREADAGTSPVENLNHLFDADNAKQGYIIALGVNDVGWTNTLNTIYAGQVGDPETDIDPENYENNAFTFVGWYAKIIQRLQSIQPDARFFLLTMPTDFGSEEFCCVIEGIAERLKNCYVVDLFHYAPPYDQDFQEKYFDGGHMNALGYLLSAHYIMTYIDWIIRHNIMDFRDVQYIGTDKRTSREGSIGITELL